MRVAFVVPHQDEATGGILTIQEYARRGASLGHDITVVVRNGRPRDIEGCRVTALRPVQGERFDAVVYPADQATPRNPLKRRGQRLPEGARICYLQGFGTPGNPVVLRNLQRGDPVIASAAWLRDVAVSLGCRAEFARYGLDRSVFHPGDSPRYGVVMMTHHLDWKGTGDGMAAISRARKIVDFSVELFGVARVGAPDTREHGRLSQDGVADLFRGSLIYLCSSWEEGFGLPGLEALACGMVLVTTDTKGSRDYATDGETALVVPPRDPVALGDALIRVLEDEELQARLRTGGLSVASEWPDWGQAASEFYGRVAALL